MQGLMFGYYINILAPKLRNGVGYGGRMFLYII